MIKIEKPSLVVDLKKVEKNIDKMIEVSKKAKAVFRPHFKTHHSERIGNIFKKKGVDKITVSSLEMAEYFANHGFDDISIAFPLNLRQIDGINNLASKIKLNLLIDSAFTARELSKKVKNKIGIFIKIDVGYHRCGLDFKSQEIDEIINVLNSTSLCEFKGFLTHAGQNYNAKGKAEIEQNVLNSINQFKYLKSKFHESIFSWGDTPSCSLSDNLSFFDELRPGNFVYYDIMQYHIGSCRMDEIAASVFCPIVSKNEQRSELVVYGGAVHLSKEFIAADKDFKLFGYVAEIDNELWGEPIPGAYVSSLSQEHGIIKIPKEKLKNFNPGDIIALLPIHSCLSANLLRGEELFL